VFGFMHVAMVGHWRDVVEEQCIKLVASGLWERTERLFIGLLGEDRAELTLRDAKAEVAYYSPDVALAELPTLAVLQQFCRSRDCLAYYVHTKGVTRPGRGTREWRHSMEHFVITRYEDCIEMLESHDVCGINWGKCDWCQFFAGNFWWARSDYVRMLPDIRSLQRIPGRDASRRFVCERWIGESPLVRAACLFNARVDHYADQPCPRSRYAQLHEVSVDVSHCSLKWAGLENRFQDLIEPVAGIRTIVVLGFEGLNDLVPLALAAPAARVVGIRSHPAADARFRDESAGRPLPQPPNATVLSGDPAEAVHLIDGPVDIVNLQGAAHYGALRREFELWAPKLRPGGCVLFHDAVNPSVERMLAELPGRKAAIPQHRGLAAWYRPACPR
jgi:SAM-dependent methyltransferase